MAESSIAVSLQMTTAEQVVTGWAIIGISWVVMGSAGLDLSPKLEAFHRAPGSNANDYIDVFDRRFWQRWIPLALICTGVAVTVEELIQLYLLTRL